MHGWGAFNVRRMIGRAPPDRQTEAILDDPGNAGRPPARYSRGVSRNRLAGPRWRCYVSPPEAPATGLSAPRRASVAFPNPSPATFNPPVPGIRESPSTYGREAGLARSPRRAPGHPFTRELRDLAARHRPRRGR